MPGGHSLGCGPMVTPLPVHGADLSHHNKDVSLARAQSRGFNGFLSLKCTQGDGFVDPMYKFRRDQARTLGMPVGPYHFGETSRPRPQVEHFLSHAGILANDFRWMLDVEDDSNNDSFFSKMSIGQRTDWVGSFVSLGFAEVGIKPFIYIPDEMPLEETFGCPHWAMRYHPSNEPPTPCPPWHRYTLRQYTDGVTGRPNFFPGLGFVDLNCWREGLNPEEQLRRHRVPEADPTDSSRGLRIDSAINELQQARGRGQRGELIREAIAVLEEIKPRGR